MKVAKNVSEFLNKCSRDVGRAEEEKFFDSLGPDIMNMESPIEQILYAAIRATAKMLGLQDEEARDVNGGSQLVGVGIRPQFPIKPYRVDFLVSYGELFKESKYSHKAVVVECDGHEFHDRSEHERRKEKRRDRFLQRAGYQVLHFTGSEIVNDPYRVACEILSVVIPFWGDTEQLLAEISEYRCE